MFREIGAILGAAAVGAVFTHRLSGQLAERLTASAAQSLGDINSITPAHVHSLPDEVQDGVILAYQHALPPVFRYLTLLFVIGLVLAFLLPDKQLASSNTELDGSTAEPQQAGVAHPVPTHAERAQG